MATLYQLLLQMTSNTMPSPFSPGHSIVTSAQDVLAGVFYEWHGCDNGVGTGILDYYGSGPTGWWQIDFGTPITISQYGIRGGSYVAALPKNWSFQVSNDGTTWTTVDTQSGITWANSPAVEQVFAISPVTARFYRIVCTVSSGQGFWGFGEILFFCPVSSGGIPLTGEGLVY